MDLRKTAEWLKNIETLSHERRELEVKLLNLPQDLDHLQTLLRDQEQSVERFQASVQIQQDKLSKLKGDIEKLDQALKESEEKAPQITNQKEYQAIQKEIESSKKQKEQLSVQLLTEEKNLTDLEQKQQEYVKNLQSNLKTFEDRKSQADKILKTAQEKEKDLEKRISNMEKELPDPVAEAIERLAVAKVFPFISEALQHNVCSACHMSFPAQLVLSSIHEGGFSQCPHCYRLLVPGEWMFE